MKLPAPFNSCLRAVASALLLFFAVSTQAQTDLSACAVDAPFEFGRKNTMLAYSSSEIVTIRVVNEGSTTQTSIPVGFDFNNGATTGSGTITGNTFPGDTVTHTFSTQIDPTAIGNHVLKVWASVGGDVNVANDTLYFTLESADNPEVILPYLQNFDNLANLTITGDEYGIPGAPELDFATTKQDTGRLRTAAGAGYYASGNRAATLDVITALGQFDTVANTLTITLDMTSYDVQDEVYLDFSLISHGEDDDDVDIIQIRGEDTENWIVLYDYDPSSLPLAQYVHVEQLNISQALDDEGHQYSESTQIRIRQRDNNASVNLSGADGMSFDNFFIYEPFYIANDPVSTSGCTSDTVEFSVNVTAEPYAFQWQVNTGSGWTDLNNNSTYEGADTNLLQIITPGIGLSGNQYRCVLESYIGVLDSSNAATLTVTSGPTFTLGSNASFCSGDSIILDAAVAAPSFLWSDSSTAQTLTVLTGGTYTVTVTDAGGCSATDQVTLTEVVSVSASASATICQGDSMFLAGAWQTMSGMYVDSIVVSGTCDTVLTTTLTVTAAPVTNVSASICLGDSILLGGAYQTMAGMYSDTLSSSGCDSIVVTTLSVDSGSVTNASASICPGDSMLLGGAFQTMPGTYYDTLASMATGCDSIIATVLSFSAAVTDTVAASICMGDSILLGGSYQTTAGAYNDTLTASSGCDSIVTTNLTVLMPATGSASVSICQGDSAFLGGAWQTMAGSYTDTLTASNGCDSIITTMLSVSTVLTTTVNASICTGDSLFAGGAWQTMSGTYVDSLQSAGGCDSVVTTNLTVNAVLSSSNPVTICMGDSVFAAGAWQTTSGSYADSLQSASGCDSVVTTVLTVLPADTETASLSICAGDSAFLAGAWQTASGVYVDSLSNASGCDSIVSTTLTVVTGFSETVPVAICAGDSVFAAGAWQTSTGMYADTLVSAGGCDSVVVTNLTVTPLPFVDVTASAQTIAEGDSTTLTATGADSYTWTPTGSLNMATGAQVIATPTDTTEYTVTGTTAGCSATANITIFVDIDDAVPFVVDGVELRAWAANGRIWLELGEGNATQYHVRVVTVSGAVVYTAQVQKPTAGTTVQIPLNGHAAGIYLLNVSNAKTHSSKRVMMR